MGELLRHRMLMQQGGDIVELLPCLLSKKGSYLIIPNTYADSESELYVKFDTLQQNNGYETIAYMANSNGQQIGGGGWGWQMDMRFGTSNAGNFRYMNNSSYEFWVNKSGWRRIENRTEIYVQRNGVYNASYSDFFIGGEVAGYNRALSGIYYEISLKNSSGYTLRLLPAKREGVVGFWESVNRIFYPSFDVPYEEYNIIT